MSRGYFSGGSMASRIPILVAVVASVACARAQPVPVVVEVGALNRGNLVQLWPGMTRGEVMELMGTDLMREYILRHRGFDISWHPDAQIPNPYRSARIRRDYGPEVELLFYYTAAHHSGDVITDDQLTPLVFEEDTLVGWGWSYLNENVQEYRVLVESR
jgi:hypothetical protein